MRPPRLAAMNLKMPGECVGSDHKDCTCQLVISAEPAPEYIQSVPRYIEVSRLVVFGVWWFTIAAHPYRSVTDLALPGG
jgi:hypothetical protein